MSVLLYGIMTFFLAFFVHFIIWKIYIPKKNQTIVLLKIFLCILFINIFLFKKYSGVMIFGIATPQNFSDYLQLIILYASLTLAYIVSYSAVEVDSPSLLIILEIASVAPDGLSREKLFEMMTDDLLLKPRIADLVNDRVIYRDMDKYKLTPKGIFFAQIFILFRKLLNAPKGG